MAHLTLTSSLAFVCYSLNPKSFSHFWKVLTKFDRRQSLSALDSAKIKKEKPYFKFISF